MLTGLKKMLKLPKNEGLNIVPFIDVMLVLLAIILSISSFIAHGQISINLPQSQSSISLNENEKKLVISIDSDNNFYLDEKKISFGNLKEAIFSANKQTTIELKSDKNAKFQSFVEIIDLLKTKEHENFQIITEKSR